MKNKRAALKYIIVLMVFLAFVNLGIMNVVADGPGGPTVVSGRVFNSDGKTPSGDHTGAYAAVIIEHDGVKSTYVDHNGLEQDPTDDSYWYAVTIPEGAWDEDDRFWIWIDGSGWGDENFTCIDHDDEGVNSWEMTTDPVLLDVNTGDYNFKPLIAIIFAIILAIVGIIIGILRPLKMPFSGRPTKPSDLVEGVMITGAAVIPGPLPKGAAAAAPAAAPAEAKEERTCPTCGGKMEFIPEYDNYYCYTCKKYPDEDELPPPEEEGPPEEELPPPDEPAPPEEEPPPPEEPPKGGA